MGAVAKSVIDERPWCDRTGMPPVLVDHEADETTRHAGDVRAGTGMADFFGGEAEHGARSRSGSCADPDAIGRGVPLKSCA